MSRSSVEVVKNEQGKTGSGEKMSKGNMLGQHGGGEK